jgi:metallo-beta-lactamase family protein
MGQSIAFYGAAETVTGSRHLLSIGDKKVLVDCGLFQGGRELRERNWLPFPIHPSEIDAMVLTHAHLDHVGYLPKLVKDGFRGPVYCTKATQELSRISLPDSGRIQEEDARRANRHGTRHQPALPLYTEADAYECMKRFHPVKYGVLNPLPGGAQFRFSPAGHILGSAFAEIFFEDGQMILMSGDLGRYNTPIIKDPTVMTHADYLVVESTYGDRLHSHEDVLAKLEEIMRSSIETGGAVLVPSFAIGRTQELLYYLRQLQDAGRMPRIPVYIDSPMAVSTTALYAACLEEHDEETQLAIDIHHSPLEPDHVTFVRDRETSKALNSTRGPLMIIAGSGMANGGRIQHHLMHRLSDPSTIVLFTGYQADGTLGRRLIEGAPMVHIMGQEIEVKARIDKVNALSAHADQGEILQWLGGFKQPPKKTFIVHGEPPAQAVLQEKIREQYGWDTVIPHQADSFTL